LSKIGIQQYVLIANPNSTDMLLHIQNFGQGNDAPSGGAYACTTQNTINFNLPGQSWIPARWTFELSLTYTGNLVNGASCTVRNASEASVGTLSLSSIGLALAPQPGQPSGRTVDESWLAPVVAFQLVVVGHAGGAHATFTSGDGYVVYECATPLVAANTWAGSAGAFNTLESSNCAYSVVADVANVALVQCFGAPPSA
jgi:hypothetical protein